MNHIIHPVHVLLIGYSDEVSKKILHGICSASMTADALPAIHLMGEEQYPNVDCILAGDGPLKKIREIWPYPPVIYGIVQDHIDHDQFTDADGYFRIDLSSSSWRENLIALIRTVIQCTTQQRILQRYNQIYQRIFSDNTVPMSLSRPDTGEFIKVNQAFLTLLGYEREEVIGKTSLDLNIFVDPDDRKKIVFGLGDQTSPWEKEIKFRAKNGRVITGYFSVSVLKWGEEDVLLTTVNDISYLKEVEASLSARNQCIQGILSSVSEGIVVYDTNLRYRVWNRFMERLTGISEEEVLGKPALVFNPLLKGDDLHELLKKALKGTESLSKDMWYHIPATGKSGWVSIIYTPFRNSDGTICGVIASVRDISERKKAEDEIYSHKGLLRSIIDTVPVSIICFDKDGRILLANASLSSSFGLKPEAIEGHRYEDFCQETRFERHMPLITRALSGREVPFNEEIEKPGESPKKRFLRGRYSPLRGTDGSITGVVAVIIDITDLKLAQATIEQVNAKLHLLSSITRHDILNSLTGILGYLTYAEEDEDQEKRAVYIKKAHQIALLIQEQIEFTRDYQDLGIKEPQWQNAEKVFIDAISGLKLGKIQIQLSLDDLWVYADPLL